MRQNGTSPTGLAIPPQCCKAPHLWSRHYWPPQSRLHQS
ncbi:Uncharacterised protein [Vibrio cholerae]|nr:Uncharacterised protein [Vibrio cholerae]